MNDNPRQRDKQYLGDGVSVSHDGYMLCLTTSNGISDTNTIYLDPDVLTALQLYVAHLREGKAEREYEAGAS